jgi:hypothetical protein
MGVTLLYGCGQIEGCVRDMRATSAFLKCVLEAGEIEQQLAREICDLVRDSGHEIVHFDCGEAVFQLDQPTARLIRQNQKSIHQSYLERIGPCITNLYYYVDDVKYAHDLMNAMGAPTYIEGPSTAVPSLTDYGPENTREAGESRNFYFMGTRHLIGLDLEFMEPNFKRFHNQSVQYPAFITPRPANGDRNLKLLRLRIVVENLEDTYDNLVKLIAPASRSKAYDLRKGSSGRSFRMCIGGIELEYCEPVLATGMLADHLNQYGPGVMAIDFGARDLDIALERARGLQRAVINEAENLLGEPGGERGRNRILSRDLMGFDVVLEQLDERLFPRHM